MANTFVTGNYYKNECREIVILVTSRTKCFITYKELWISDPHNCYQEGKIKVRLTENNDEFVLIDGFSKYSSVDEYVKYVKEEYSAVHRNFIRVGKKFKYVDLKNDILQDVIFEDTNGNGTILNFRAINNGNPIYCHGSLFVVTEHNRDCLKPFNYLTVEDSNLPLPTNATVNNVKEEEIKETLEDSNLPLPTNAIANNAKDLVLPLTKSLTFKEVREYAENAGYEVEPLGGMFRLIKNNVIKTFPSLKTLQLFITEELVEKKEITLEDSDLPSPDNNAIATVNNLEEEIKENMLTKESYAAIKLLVKMDFNDKNLTQFEVMALTSLKKYVENGIEPKLIKTFAEVLIKKLTPEERVQLRDLSLKKVFKGRRLEDVREYFRGDSDNKAKENLKSYIRGVMSEETFLSLCESEGIKKDKAHEISLKWLEFIDSVSVDESWEDSWQEFKKSEGFKELKASS